MQVRYSLPESNMSQPRRGCRFSPAPAHDTVSALGRRWPDRLNGIPMKVHLGAIRLLVCSVLASRPPAYKIEDQKNGRQLYLTSAPLDFAPGEKITLYVLGKSFKCPSLGDSALSLPFPVMSSCPVHVQATSDNETITFCR